MDNKLNKIVRRIGCVFGTHSREYRISKNSEFTDYPNYAVCLDCGSAERTIAPIPWDQKQKISHEELQRLEKDGFEINEGLTIHSVGIKRHHLLRYDPELVKRLAAPLGQYLNPFSNTNDSYD